MTLADALRFRAARVRLLGLDVDGVLTDGRLVYGPGGEEQKTFHVRDGLGIKLLRQQGVHVAVISGRRSAALEARLEELGFHVGSGAGLGFGLELGVGVAVLGCDDKAAALADVLARTGISADDAAFVGDDVPDLPAMRAAGLAIAVRDAHPSALAMAAWVTDARGGEGAVREVADTLLDVRGELEVAMAAYLGGAGERAP